MNPEQIGLAMIFGPAVLVLIGCIIFSLFMLIAEGFRESTTTGLCTVGAIWWVTTALILVLI